MADCIDRFGSVVCYRSKNSSDYRGPEPLILSLIVYGFSEIWCLEFEVIKSKKLKLKIFNPKPMTSNIPRIGGCHPPYSKGSSNISYGF